MKETKSKILIIDDEEVVLDSCAQILEGGPYHAATAMDGTFGLELVREFHPDVVFVDLKMLDLSGRPGLGPDRLQFLEFAVNWPNPVDPFYQHNPGENSDRFMRYSVQGAPALYSDGVSMAS